MSIEMKIENELYCVVECDDVFFAKKGSMVAYKGNLKFEKRLLGTNNGSLGSQIWNHVKRKLTGENIEIMEVKGQGTCYLAENSEHISIIDLEPNGIWNNISVESENLLAFTKDCYYNVVPLGTGIFSQKGLFTSNLSYNGSNSKVAIKMNGNPLVLSAPCCVDPDCVIAWTGKNPSIKTDINFKTFLGQTSGESYMFEFNQPDQLVIIQPTERVGNNENGIKLNID